MSNQPTRDHYDIVIIGGGMVGATFAIAAQHALAGVSVLVIEAKEIAREGDQSPSFDDRSTALSYGSAKILDEIGLWQEMRLHGTKIETIHVSDKGHVGVTSLDCKDYDVEALGYVIGNREFGQVVNARLIDSDSITLKAPASVNSIKPTPQGMTLKLHYLDQEVDVSSSLVVLADGGRSPLCEGLGIAKKETSYEQQALIANVAFERPHLNKAYERFTDTGPLAVLPLKSMDQMNLASLVWTIEQGQAEEFASLTEEQLKARLQERFGDRLGKVHKIGKIISYPLILTIAKEQVRPGLVLLGNAAHTLHPVAGQGFNLAMRDISALVKNLVTAKASAQAYGDMAVLQNYLDNQSRDQKQAIAATDALTKLFSNRSIAKSLVRKLGLLSLEVSPALSQEFAKRAMGTVS